MRHFFSSFLSLPECPKYKPSITLLSCSFYAWIKLDFCEDILGNQSNYCDWYFLMYNLYFWCIMMWNHMSMIDQKKKWFVFKLRKLIEKKQKQKTGHWSKFWKSFQLFLMNKFWFMNRFLYFFINMHAQIEKLIAKIKSIIWNTWMEISLTASFGVKCGVEVCSKLLNSNVA